MKNERNNLRECEHDHNNQSHGAHGLSCGCEYCETKAAEVVNSKYGVFSAFKFDFIKIVLSAILIIAACFISNELVKLILFICAAIVCGYELFINCIKNISINIKT